MSEKNEWKLVPVIATDDMEAAAEDDYEQTGATFPRWKSAYAAMLNAAPSAPGDAQDERQAFEAWAEDQGFVLDCDFFEVSGQYYDSDDTQLAYDIWRAARASAPAAGDALDARRYRLAVADCILVLRGDAALGRAEWDSKLDELAKTKGAK